jgi:hypothetical protein
MRSIFVAAVAAIALSGCGAVGGGGEKAAMIKSCVTAGQTEKECQCVADGLEKGLDAETFKVVAKAMSIDEAEGQKMMEALPADKQGAVMGALMSSGMSCMMGGATEG